MPWLEVIGELEDKLHRYWRGTYRPLDGLPFFRVQYPPAEEREAIRQFSMLAQRLQAKGTEVLRISLTDVLGQTLAELTNAKGELTDALRHLEASPERGELQTRLANLLPDELAQRLAPRLQPLSRDSAAFLLRLGALYPFVRSSALLSRLENRVHCTVILPYPGTALGTWLDAPEEPHLGYYRGEAIAWR